MSDTVTKTNTKTKQKTPSLWKVILLNDDFTDCGFVVQVLMQIFNKDSNEAVELMQRVHEKGSAVVCKSTKEICITKTEQVRNVAERYGHPLLAVAEEA